MRLNLSGAGMLGTAVVIVTATVALISHHEMSLREAQTEASGIALANTVGRIPFEQLVSTGDRVGLLPLVRATRYGSNFAYASISRPSGEVIEVVSEVGAIPPGGPVAENPSAWNQQRRVDLPGGDHSAWEIQAPIIDQGRLVAVVRFGFRTPNYFEVVSASAIYGIVALLVFLSCPLAYFWMRHQLVPLSAVAGSLPPSDLAQGRRIESSAGPTELIASAVARIQSFCDEMDERSESMNRERLALLASSKVSAHERNRLKNLLEAVPDAVLGLASDGNVIAVNARAESFLRRSAEEIMGSPPSAWCPSPELVRLIGRYTGSAGNLRRVETVEFSPDDVGQRRFRASLHPVSESDGMALVIRDVTAEQAARETQAEFLGHMAHELKAPLNVISMYGESLLGPDGKDEEQRINACNVIADEVGRLNDLINSIFSIGRVESGNVSVDRQRVRTREFLADVFEATRRSGDELGLIFDLELPNSMEAIFVDKQLMSVAIKNLLTNAVKYNRQGGSVTLLAEEQDVGLLISVRDTGLGIAEQDLDQIFEKFYRSEDDMIRKVTGHGLGLALVKEIVALHGGEIRVTSEVGEGSEFSLFFSRNSAIFREDG